MNRPPIVLSSADHAVLERAAMDGLLSAPREAGALLDELSRAQVIDDDEVGPDVVRVGSLVTFREGSGDPRTIRLIAPDQACRDAHDESVLTSTGAALLGLRVGQSILWPDRIGGERVLTIVSVSRPAADPIRDRR
jgi:regulator of nucleoside diphosphate kinase